MGSVFEEICQQYLYLPEVYVSLPFPIGNSGRWWGNNPAKRRQEEIDIMAVQEESGLFCECKWKNSPAALDVVLLLKERGELFHYENKYYIIFSKSGFTDQAVEYSKLHKDTKLISFDDINRKIIS